MKLSHLGFVVDDIEKSSNRFLGTGYKIEKEMIFDPKQNIYCLLLSAENLLPIELISPGPGDRHPLKSRLNRGGGVGSCVLRGT